MLKALQHLENLVVRKTQRGTRYDALTFVRYEIHELSR